MRKTLALLTLAGVAALASCSSADIKAGARAVQAGATELQREVNAEFNAGEISAADADLIRLGIVEVAAAAGRVATDPRDFDRLDSADKRQVVEQFIAATADAAERLDAQGALRIKSERGRRRFEKALRNIRRGLAVARVVEAALPPPALVERGRP